MSLPAFDLATLEQAVSYFAEKEPGTQQAQALMLGLLRIKELEGKLQKATQVQDVTHWANHIFEVQMLRPNRSGWQCREVHLLQADAEELARICSLPKPDTVFSDFRVVNSKTLQEVAYYCNGVKIPTPGDHDCIEVEREPC